MRTISCIVSAFATTGHAQNFLDRIGWQRASGTFIIAVLAAVVLVFIILGLYYYGRRFQSRQEKQAVDEAKFEEDCERIGLNATEKSKLRQLIRHENMMQPHVILQSVSVFERCVDKEVKRLLSHHASAAEQARENDLLSSIRRKAGFMFLPLEHPLVSTRNIALGQTGAVFGANHRIPLIGHTAMVERNEFTFKLQYDADKEDVFRIAPGSMLKYVFTRQNDGMYGVEIRVAQADAGYIEAYHTLDMRRNQLRQYVRVEVSLPVKVRLLQTDDPEKSGIRRGEVIEAHMSDVSGGGLSFICDRPCTPGDLVSATFSLPVGSFSGLQCKVLRISLQEGTTRTYYKHHTQFVNLEIRKRDMIVKYVFDKQRQLSQWR